MTGGRQVGESAGPSETVASEKTEEKADTSRNIQIFSPNLSADFARHTGAGSATKLKMTPIRIVLTNIFLLFTLSAYSENVVDSLVTAFDHQKGSQAARTAEAFFRYLAESGFTENTVELIPGSEADSVKALTLYWAGEWYYDIQDYDRSIEYSSKALSLSRKVSAKEIECDCDNILSIAYFRKSDFHKSLEYAKATLALGRELQDEERITYSLNTLAGICLASKQPAEGVKYVLEAIRICEKRNDSLKLAVRCGMAAEIHHSMGEDEKSLEYSRRAYDINKAMGWKTRLRSGCRRWRRRRLPSAGTMMRKNLFLRHFQNWRKPEICSHGPSVATRWATSVSKKGTMRRLSNISGLR